MSNDRVKFNGRFMELTNHVLPGSSMPLFGLPSPVNETSVLQITKRQHYRETVMGMPIRLQGWSKEAIDKARMFELIQHFGSLAAIYNPELMRYVAPCIEQLQPLRLACGGRHLYAWGRCYTFDAHEAQVVKLLVRNYKRGSPIVLHGNSAFIDHPALIEGVIQRQNDTYWLQMPESQRTKPRLVVFTEAEPEEVLSKKMRALAILAEHPEWSDSRIAKEVPCSRTSLYDWDEFVSARKLLNQGRQKYQRDCTIEVAHD